MDGTRTNRRRWTFVVSAVVVVRAASAALFFFAFINNLRAWAIALFAFACLTDALDGQLARKLGVSPSLGAYSDAVADFLLVLAAFSAFVIKGIYPWWTLLLVVAMFLQFVLTSGPRRPLYDPIGKYYGVFLFAAIGLTLVFLRPTVYNAILVSILGLSALSVASRSVFLWQRTRKMALADTGMENGEIAEKRGEKQ